MPTQDEWSELTETIEREYGYSDDYGYDDYYDRHLKAKSGWDEWLLEGTHTVSGNGNDTYGFAALPGGSYSYDDFQSVGSFGYWWSESEYDDNEAYARIIRNKYIEDADWHYYLTFFDKTNLYSVRCLKGD